MKYEINLIDLVGVNSYLIKTEQGFILVDTGGPMFLDKELQTRREEVKKRMNEMGCTKENLNLIILTHGDCDHSFNAEYFHKQFNAPIAMHYADKYLVENLNVEAILGGCQYQAIIYRLFLKLMNKKIHKLSEKIVEEFTNFTPQIELIDGMRLDQYGLPAQIVHIPGHTPGSIAIITDIGECIIGDTFANIKKPQISLNAVNFKQLSESVQKLKSYAFTKVYPGHGKPYTM